LGPFIRHPREAHHVHRLVILQDFFRMGLT
jgi:hypothetical protein